MTAQNSLLSIRKATPHDLKAIQDIAYNTWPATYSSILSPAALNYMLEYFYSLDALTAQMETGQQFFLVETEGHSIGFGSVTEITPQVFKLNKLYVLPEHQKTGAGRVLMDHAFEIARSNHATQLILNVNRNNPAVHFYKKIGFSIIKEEDVDLGGGVVQEDYVMAKEL